jgi:pyrroline-5-carboxylate reductase
MKISIIGAGNIGGAVARGLLKSKFIAPKDLSITDVDDNKLKAFKNAYAGLVVNKNGREAVEAADIVILAVKPWLVEPVLSGITDALTAKKIFICIAAGITCETLSNILNAPMPLFRVMPNTAMMIGESMTFISSQDASKEQEQLVLDIFSKLGKATMIEEKLMNPATSVASCGIAYALRYLRAAVEGAVELGFRADEAHKIVAQTMIGAAQLVLQNNSHPEEEIDKVTTPGGWTIKGLNEMEAHGFTNSVIKGLQINK